jgi:MFS family permease
VLNNWFVKKRGFAVGLAMTFSGLGGAVMNPVLAWVIQSFGWRTAYLVNAGITGAIVLPFLIFVLRLRPSDKGLKPYGWEEREAAQEALTGEMGVSRDEAVHSAAFVIMAVIFAATGFLGSYTQIMTPYGLSLGLAVSAAAILPSLNMICNAVSKLAMGAINDRFGGKVMIYSGLTAVLASMLLLLNGLNPPAGLYIGAFMAGTFLTVMTVSAPLMVHTIFGARDDSRIYVYLSLGQSLFISSGTTIIGFMYDYTGSYSMAFVVGATVTFTTMVMTHFALAAGRRLTWS